MQRAAHEAQSLPAIGTPLQAYEAYQQARSTSGLGDTLYEDVRGGGRLEFLVFFFFGGGGFFIVVAIYFRVWSLCG
jgi:hypothetical protein